MAAVVEELTELNFPSSLEIRTYIEQKKISALLNQIKSKILATEADFILLSPPDLLGYAPSLVARIKVMLGQKGYQVIDREDITGIPCGFKITWDSRNNRDGPPFELR